MAKAAPFGWTVIALGGGSHDVSQDRVITYKRDCPADKAHYAADLAPFTYPTRREAMAAGKGGHYAYKQ